MSESRKDREVQKALDILPLGLNETYIRALDQINAQPPYTKELARKTFMWVIYGKRPLGTKELQHALATDEPYHFAEGTKLDAVDVILGACANLLVVDELSIEPVLRPIYYSVQEFLQKPPDSVLERCRMAKINDGSYMHTQLAITCISHLRSRVTRGPSPHASWLASDVLLKPFTWYAACSFDYHILNSSVLSHELQQHISAFLEQESWFLSSVLQLRAVKHERDCLQKPTFHEDFDSFHSLASLSAMVFATELYGVPGLQDRLKGLKPDALALHRACRSGSISCIAQLIADGCDIDAKNDQGVGPIYYAASREDLPILRMLLEKGADVNAQGGDLHTALQVACYRGAGSNVKLLLDHGANVNAQGGRYENALQAASLVGNIDITKLLLKNGANVNVEGGYYNTVLTAASYGGNERIVKMLLDSKADVNARGGRYGTALVLASRKGFFIIVKLLLDNGADVNAQSGEGRYSTALIAASYRDEKEIVELLLENGADINRLSGRYGNALAAASYRGNINIVQLLLEKGAKASSTGMFRSALQRASSEGHKQVVELLLLWGADIHERNEDWTALHSAVSGGHQDVIELLISQGADINSYAKGHTPLYQAAGYTRWSIPSWWGPTSCQSEIIDLLLNKGADIESRCEGRTPLLIASENGNREVIELLLLRVLTFASDVKDELRRRWPWRKAIPMSLTCYSPTARHQTSRHYQAPPPTIMQPSSRSQFWKRSMKLRPMKPYPDQSTDKL